MGVEVVAKFSCSKNATILNREPENFLLKQIFSVINSIEWQLYSFNFSFIAKKNDRGFEISNIKITDKKGEKINFKYDREKKIKDPSKNKKRDNSGQIKGGIMRARMYALKRMNEARLKQKELQNG